TILVNRWWTELPTLNVGLATGDESGFFVLDADPDKGGDESLRRLEKEHGALPQTRVAISGSGGTDHFFLNCGDNCDSASVIAPGLDIRGNGGYVVLPPSIHPNGNAYRWGNQCDVVEPPEWLLKRIAEKQPVDSNGKRKGKPLEEWHRVLTNPIAHGTR